MKIGHTVKFRNKYEFDQILDNSENRKGNDRVGFIYLAKDGNSIYNEADTIFLWYDKDKSVFCTNIDGEEIREQRDIEVLKDIEDGYVNNDRFVLLKNCQMDYFLHGNVSACRKCFDINNCFSGIKEQIAAIHG